MKNQITDYSKKQKASVTNYFFLILVCMLGIPFAGGQLVFMFKTHSFLVQDNTHGYHFEEFKRRPGAFVFWAAVYGVWLVISCGVVIKIISQSFRYVLSKIRST